MKRKFVPFARQLRTASTDAERLLWRHVRAHRFEGCKFKRQESIGKYIVDFVCYEVKLIIELDGGQHLENVSDKQRDDWLSLQGFRVLRFWNNDVLSNIEGVLQRVCENLSPTSSKEKRNNKSISPSPRPSPTRGEGEGLQRARITGEGGGENVRPASGEGVGAKRVNLGKSKKSEMSPVHFDKKAQTKDKSPLSLDGTREHLERSRGQGRG
jgi:very-short-patch-repair endonuclease